MIKQLVFLAVSASLATAQDFTLTVGGSHAAPRNVEGIKPDRSTALVAGIGLRIGDLRIAATNRSSAGSTVYDDGVDTHDTYAWGYRGASLSYGLTFARSASMVHQVVFGGEFRREQFRAKSKASGASLDGSKSRAWARVGYEGEVTGERDRPTTTIYAIVSFAKNDAYDSKRTYSVSEGLALYAPSVDVQFGVTIRF